MKRTPGYVIGDIIYTQPLKALYGIVDQSSLGNPAQVPHLNVEPVHAT